ncbi:MAG: DUF692 domain-containing protein [Gemmataceae bacterium]|nr:DUF692 domain-containing protein [Gemmataceae bacterium]
MALSLPNLGLGIGWRAQLAHAILNRPDIGFVEILAEDYFLNEAIPAPLQTLHDRGVHIIPHGVGLNLGGAEAIDPARLAALGELAQRMQAPFVSEHIAFVRAAGLETGHLLPIPRTPAMLDILVENIRLAEAALPVPLVLENIAILFDWPNAEMDEAAFLNAICERTDAMLLLDLENIYANARNLGGDPVALLDRLPLERVAYVHVAGGYEANGIFHDTHAHPLPEDVVALVEALYARAAVPGVMLERDDRFPDDAELNTELDAIVAAMQRGNIERHERGFAHPVLSDA